MDTKEMKKCRKSIDILQVAATDKENLSRKIAPKKKLTLNNGSRLRLGKKEEKMIEPDAKNLVAMKNNINKMKIQSKPKRNSDDIIATDLTSDSPSEKYWEKLAESRRVALESALKENVDLTNELAEMEYENSRLRDMLNEAQTLVEVLTEMLEGNQEDEPEKDKIEESVPSRSNESFVSDSDNENDSLQPSSHNPSIKKH